jgi:tubulin--tyrosine ligase-like protein 12
LLSGHTISQNLQQLIRISETDSVIFQKYIDRPLLFRDRKFDLRFIVLLKSVQPLDLMVCSDFLVRVSNLPFQLSHFEQYERHFTVFPFHNSILFFKTHIHVWKFC